MLTARTIAFSVALVCWRCIALAEVVVFDDWRVVCGKSDGTQSCQMLQSQPAQAGGTNVFLLSIGQAEGSSIASAVVSVPLGVYLANGIDIHIAGQRRFKAQYEICDHTSCHAGFVLRNSVLQAFKRGNRATFRVWTEVSKAVEFPVSLKGFTAGFVALRASLEQ